MKKIYSIFWQLYKVATFQKISLFDRLRFLFLYPLSLVFAYFSSSYYKSAFFLNGSRFKFSGEHLNLLLSHLNSHLSYYYPYYEKAKTIVDVGASFGTFPKIAQYFNSKTKILAIEMAKESFSLLQENCVNLKKVELFRYAVGNRKGITSYTLDPRYPEGANVNLIKYIHKGKAQLITLDELLRSRVTDNISLLKIDVEGYELNVLKGAKETLKRTQTIIVEVNLEMSNLIAVLDLLNKTEFHFVKLGSINFREDGSAHSADMIFIHN